DASISRISSRVGTLMCSACSTAFSSSGVGSSRSIQTASAGKASLPDCTMRTSPCGRGTKTLSTSGRSSREWRYAWPGLRRQPRGALAALLACREIVDDGEELARAAPRHADVGLVLPVDDDDRHAFRLVALRQLLGTLQVGADAEGIPRLVEVFGFDAVRRGEVELHLLRARLVVGDEHVAFEVDGLEHLVVQIEPPERLQHIEEARMRAVHRAPHHGHAYELDVLRLVLQPGSEERLER